MSGCNFNDIDDVAAVLATRASDSSVTSATWNGTAPSTTPVEKFLVRRAGGIQHVWIRLYHVTAGALNSNVVIKLCPVSSGSLATPTMWSYSSNDILIDGSGLISDRNTYTAVPSPAAAFLYNDGTDWFASLTIPVSISAKAAYAHFCYQYY